MGRIVETNRFTAKAEDDEEVTIIEYQEYHFVEVQDKNIFVTSNGYPVTLSNSSKYSIVSIDKLAHKI
jgi:hypothetical protein